MDALLSDPLEVQYGTWSASSGSSSPAGCGIHASTIESLHVPPSCLWKLCWTELPICSWKQGCFLEEDCFLDHCLLLATSRACQFLTNCATGQHDGKYVFTWQEYLPNTHCDLKCAVRVTRVTPTSACMCWRQLLLARTTS